MKISDATKFIVRRTDGTSFEATKVHLRQTNGTVTTIWTKPSALSEANFVLDNDESEENKWVQ